MSRAKQIARVLDDADAYEAVAWRKRRAIGRVLVEMREELPDIWLKMSGLDAEVAEALITIAEVDDE